jgi:hypothetical protein
MPKIVKKYGKITLILSLILILLAVYLVIPEGQAASISSRSITISDSRPSQTGVTYDFAGTHTSTLVKCLDIQFCTSASGTCTLPTGMSVNSASATSTGWNQWDYTGGAGWSEGFATTAIGSAGGFRYTSATGETGGSAYSFSATNITNPSATSTAFARVATYTDTACSTPSAGEDTGVAAFAIISGISVTATVAETLTFEISAVASGQTVKGAVTTNFATATTTLPFGTLSTTTNQIGAHDLTVSTNASGGYTTTVQYTGALTSGANTITDWTGPNDNPTAFPSAGTEAWGYTTNDAALGTGTTTRFGTNNVWAGFSTTAYEVAYSSVAVSSEATRMGYQAGISGTTESGDYSTTVVYVCTPVY